MREKLIELLNNSFEKQYEKRGLLTAPHTAEDLIAHGVTVTDNNVGGKWIPVTERLPQMHKERYEDCVEPTGYGKCFVSDPVMAYCPSGKKFYVVECVRSDENSPLYWDEINSDIAVRPTHWMPMPEPPKGE